MEIEVSAPDGDDVGRHHSGDGRVVRSRRTGPVRTGEALQPLVIVVATALHPVQRPVDQTPPGRNGRSRSARVTTPTSSRLLHDRHDAQLAVTEQAVRDERQLPRRAPSTAGWGVYDLFDPCVVGRPGLALPQADDVEQTDESQRGGTGCW